MEHIWLFSPFLLGTAMARSPGAPVVSPQTEAPTPSNLPFAVDSMVGCLIDPSCDMAMPTATSHPVFSTTTKVNGDLMTIKVQDAGSSGFLININDAHHHMNCSAATTSPVALTCDTKTRATQHVHHAYLSDTAISKKVLVAYVICSAVLGMIGLLLLVTCCCFCITTRRSKRQALKRTSTDQPGEHTVTEITKTTQSSGVGTLGRAAEEGRSLAPFAAGAGAGAAAANRGRGASGLGSGASNGSGQGVGAGQSGAGVGQGAGAGQAMGQGGEALGTGAASGSGLGQGGMGQGGMGQGATTVTGVDQGGSDIVDTGSVRGRRTLRGTNSQVVA